MAIELQETFQINAPIDVVWQFLLSPENVATCMPGASLTEIVDDKSFVGTMKLKLGAINAKFNGTITYSEVDKDNNRVVLLAEAKDTSGGTVKGTITAKMTPTTDRVTELQCEANIDLTGRLLQVGRGLIDGVAAQIIGKFIKNVQNMLESQAQEGAAEGESATSAEAAEKPVVDTDDSINVLAVVLKAIWIKIVGLFKRKGK